MKNNEKEVIYIAEIIDFVAYKNMKEEEQRRVRMVSVLSNRRATVDGLLHSMNDSIGISFLTKHFGEMNQVVGKEHIIDKDLLTVIVNALSDYKKSLSDEITELNKIG